MKRRCFITFYLETGSTVYKEIAHLLLISIKSFSDYDLIVYTEQDFINDDIPGRGDCSFSGIMKWKYIAIKKTLELYDEVVWLDSDIIVNHRIDDIWNYFNKVEYHPIVAEHRFSNFINPPIFNGVSDLRECDELRPIIHLFNCNTSIDIWKQCCIMLMNKNCRNVIDELLYYSYQGINDEPLMNLLYNKYNVNYAISGIFMDSWFFNTYIHKKNLVQMEEVDYVHFMDTYIGGFYNNNDGLLTFSHNIAPLKLKENNYHKILCWHGTKSVDTASKILIDVLKVKHKLL